MSDIFRVLGTDYEITRTPVLDANTGDSSYVISSPFFDLLATVVIQNPIYETYVIYAEENGAISGNQQEWSYGNGATGQIGITLPMDLEVFALSINGDVSDTGGPVTIALRDNTNGVDLFNETFPLGEVNNISEYVILETPYQMFARETLGFRTVTETGVNSDFRCAAWLRRKIN